MKLTVLKIQEQKSKFGQTFYYIFLKSDTGKSFKTCAYPAYRNFCRCHWDEVVARGIGSILEYNSLSINMKGLLDADISFVLLPKETLNDTTKQ